MDIGMHKESVKLAKQLLKSEPIDSLMFYQSLHAIFVGDNPRKFKGIVNAAYDRLSHTDKMSAQEHMLHFTNMIGEYKRAQNFIPAKSDDPHTLLIAMKTCLENKEFAKAKSIQKQCMELLSESSEELGTSLLLYSLAEYADSLGNHEEAEKYWLKLICLDEPTFPSAVRGLIRNKAAQAWKHVQFAQAQIQKFRGNIDSTTVLALPGNHDCLLDQARKNLNTYRKALEKIVPEKDLPKCGIE